MHHLFHLAASRFKSAADLIAWLRESALELMPEAEIGEPAIEDGAYGFWIDLSGERHRLEARNDSADWLVTVERQEPLFVRPREAGRQARFDAMVATLRAVIVADPSIRLLGEQDD